MFRLLAKHPLAYGYEKCGNLFKYPHFMSFMLWFGMHIIVVVLGICIIFIPHNGYLGVGSVPVGDDVSLFRQCFE